MYVITGATGNTGNEIARKLLQSGKKVRAIARDKNRLKSLEAQGAEIRQGSLDDSKFLANTFEGATAVYAMIPTDQRAEDLFAYMNRIGESIYKALRQSKVPNVVNLSSIGAALPSGTGPISGLHHQEQRLNQLEANVLHLRPTFFMDNFLVDIPMIREMGIMGSPARPDVILPMIATKDIGDVAADRLNRLDFKGKTVLDLLGPRDVAFAEAAKILGAAIGKPDLPYVQFSYEDAEKGMVQGGLSADIAEKYVEMYRSFNDGVIKPIPRKPENITPTTIEQFAKIFADAYNAHSKS
ncbi:NmrA family NAD(P)-binding protein [bacterium]|nr:NmrA family NAD(P)-binding protein [bacterium]